MDLNILNSAFQNDTVIDYYQSLIWTERFNEIGDFELFVWLKLFVVVLTTAGFPSASVASRRVSSCAALVLTALALTLSTDKVILSNMPLISVELFFTLVMSTTGRIVG